MRSVISGIQIPTDSRINIDGGLTLDSLAGTSGQVLTSQGAGVTPIWTTVSGGGSGFTGAGTSITGVTGTLVSGSGSVTNSSPLYISSGGASGGFGVNTYVATSADLYLTSGTASGFNTVTGNVYIEGGAPTYDTIDGGYTNGNIFIGKRNTGSVYIGNPDLYTGSNFGATNIYINPQYGSFVKYTYIGNGVSSNATISSNVDIANYASPYVKIGTNAGGGGLIEIGTQAKTPIILYHAPFLPSVATAKSSSPLAAADLAGGIITAAPSSNLNLALPTATSMDSYFTSVPVNLGFEWVVINTGSSTVTITLGTSHTVTGNGNMVVASSTSARFRSVRTATTPTWKTYRVA